MLDLLSSAMDNTPTQQLATLLLGEPVLDWIAQRRAQGKTWRAIARELDQRTDHRVDVTYETLRIWAGERIAS